MKRRFPLGILLFAGLPLLGWGFADVPGFFASPGRLGYLVLINVLQAVAAIWFPAALQESGTGEKLVPRQRFVIRWLQLASLLLVMGGPFCDRRSLMVFAPGEALRLAGVALAVPGFVLMLWARAALGRQFSLHVTIQQDHRLVTDGLYRFLRHPRYAGILLFLAGTALVYRSWAGVLLVTASLGVLLWRIRDEEQLLHREFAGEWEAYCRRSWRLLPPVY